MQLMKFIDISQNMNESFIFYSCHSFNSIKFFEENCCQDIWSILNYSQHIHLNWKSMLIRALTVTCKMNIDTMIQDIMKYQRS